MLKHYFRGNRTFRPCQVSFKVDIDTLECLDYFAEFVLRDTRSSAVSFLLDASFSNEPDDVIVDRFFNSIHELPPKRSRNCFYSVSARVSEETYNALRTRLELVNVYSDCFPEISFNAVCLLSLRASLDFFS